MQVIQTTPMQSTHVPKQKKRLVAARVLLASALFLFLQTFILPNVPQIANGQSLVATSAPRFHLHPRTYAPGDRMSGGSRVVV